MQKKILLEILKQNQFTSHFSLDRVSSENASYGSMTTQHLLGLYTVILVKL
jgi:hypothetical protein